LYNSFIAHIIEERISKIQKKLSIPKILCTDVPIDAIMANHLT